VPGRGVADAAGAARARGAESVARSDPGIQSRRPELATDGRRLYFTVTERLSDIWTMELTRSVERTREVMTHFEVPVQLRQLGKEAPAAAATA